MMFSGVCWPLPLVTTCLLCIKKQRDPMMAFLGRKKVYKENGKVLCISVISMLMGGGRHNIGRINFSLKWELHTQAEVRRVLQCGVHIKCICYARILMISISYGHVCSLWVLHPGIGIVQKT